MNTRSKLNEKGHRRAGVARCGQFWRAKLALLRRGHRRQRAPASPMAAATPANMTLAVSDWLGISTSPLTPEDQAATCAAVVWFKGEFEKAKAQGSLAGNIRSTNDGQAREADLQQDRKDA